MSLITSPGAVFSGLMHLGFVAWLVGWALNAEPPPEAQVTPALIVTEADYVTAVAASMTPQRATPVVPTEQAQLAVPAEPAAIVPTAPVVPAAPPVPTRLPPVEPVQATARTPSDSLFVEAATPRIITPNVPSAAAPVALTRTATTPVTVTTTTEAVPDESRPTDVEAAPRPPERPSDLGEELEPPSPSEAEPQVAAEATPEPVAAPTEDAAAGTSRAAEAAQAADAAAAATAEAAAQAATAAAAAAGYPNQVMAQLSRTRRDRVSTSGTAVIGFTISDAGGLAALGVAQSSGVADVDQAGLALVQRAAPFAPPPPGAQRSYSFQFTGN